MMDLLAVQVKGCNLLGLRSLHHWMHDKRCSFAQGGVLEISAMKWKSSFAPPPPHGFRSVGVVKAMARLKKNNSNDKSSSSSSSGNVDRSVPGGNGSKGDGPFEESKDTASLKSHLGNLDWRKSRENSLALEQAERVESNAHNQGGTDQESESPDLKWAHPIPAPESGCVLVATEKLDGHLSFERTVVLLLRYGTKHEHERPFGIVINRPLNWRFKDMKTDNVGLATTFADCSLHFGGPLDASMVLIKTEEKSKLPAGFEEVIPGLCFSDRNNWDEAAELVKKGVLKPQDLRFFDGYICWQLDKLRKEIESNCWIVATCSSNLIFGTFESSSKNLWEEILQLMGVQYSDLSQNPRKVKLSYDSLKRSVR